MTNFAITVTDRINLFGIAPADLWGQMRWGDLWGAGTNPEVQAVQKPLAMGSVIITDTKATDSTKRPPSEVLTLLDDLGSITLVDAAGYYHVFRGQVTNLDDLIPSSWVDVANPADGFVREALTTTTWTKL